MYQASDEPGSQDAAPPPLLRPQHLHDGDPSLSVIILSIDLQVLGQTLSPFDRRRRSIRGTISRGTISRTLSDPPVTSHARCYLPPYERRGADIWGTECPSPRSFHFIPLSVIEESAAERGMAGRASENFLYRCLDDGSFCVKA